MTIPTIGDGLVGYDGEVDPRGMITLLNQIRDALNCPSFRVDRNGVNQAGIVTATITAIQFNNVVFDTDKGWNSTSFLYQPTVPGVYLFGVQDAIPCIRCGVGDQCAVSSRMRPPSTMSAFGDRDRRADCALPSG